MKLLIIHNYHRKGSASGDDEVFRNETALLEQHGHEVVRYSVSNDEFDQVSKLGKLLSACSMIWSFRHAREVRDIIRREHPDLVHVHTFFPLLSPSILYAAKREGVPVVATLHDTRLICPCATSLRGTELCNKCGDGHYLRMVKYGCFKGSRAQSLIVAIVFAYHGARKTFTKQIDRYICLNDNQIRLLEGIGLDPDKIRKKYNFVQPPVSEHQSDPATKTEASTAADAHTDQATTTGNPQSLPPRYALFYGRIGEEKGVRQLMKIWEQLPEIPLVVMGGGPLADEFAQWAAAPGHEHVTFLGYVNHDDCMSIVRKGEFVVFPSIWYEGCSMVEIESMSLGKALIATDLGFSEEAITEDYNGIKVPLGDTDGFVKAIRKLWADPQKSAEMGRNALREYDEKYEPEKNYEALVRIYEEVLHGHGDRSSL